jgi:hypothetical protein
MSGNISIFIRLPSNHDHRTWGGPRIRINEPGGVSFGQFTLIPAIRTSLFKIETRTSLERDGDNFNLPNAVPAPPTSTHRQHGGIANLNKTRKERPICLSQKFIFTLHTIEEQENVSLSRKVSLLYSCNCYNCRISPFVPKGNTASMLFYTAALLLLNLHICWAGFVRTYPRPEKPAIHPMVAGKASKGAGHPGYVKSSLATQFVTSRSRQIEYRSGREPLSEFQAGIVYMMNGGHL